jgi:hypothetical protein
MRVIKRRVLSFAFAVLVAASVTARTSEAQQVSEADRQGARDLWQQGYQLQQAGQYAEALDKFTRAQAVFSAPTNLLHMAECQAQLGMLVEAAETYRGLINLALPPNSPPAFGAAQTQGKAELQQVEARIPKVIIQVAPANVRNLLVTIDGQSMNVALVGVERPIDPGQHKILVGAPGYVREERAVVIKEKEPAKVVAFALQPGGSVVLAQPAPPMVNYPPGTVIYTQPYPALQPYAIPSERPYVPPKKKDYSNVGFLVGGRIGAAIPTGALTGAGGNSTGVGVDIESYLRFAHKGLVGLYGGHDFYKGANGATAGSTPVGAAIGFTTNPEGVGFFGDLTVGFRWFNQGGSGATEGSFEGGIGAGIWIAAGKSLRIVPRVDLFGGSLDSNGYAAFFVGVAAYYNNDVKPKTVAAPAPMATPSPALTTTTEPTAPAAAP